MTKSLSSQVRQLIEFSQAPFPETVSAEVVACLPEPNYRVARLATYPPTLHLIC